MVKIVKKCFLKKLSVWLALIKMVVCVVNYQKGQCICKELSKRTFKVSKKIIFFSPILTNNNLSLKIYCENIMIAFLNFNFSFFILFFPYFFTFFSSIFPSIFSFFSLFFSPPHTYPSNYFFLFLFSFLSPFSLPGHSRTFHFSFLFSFFLLSLFPLPLLPPKRSPFFLSFFSFFSFFPLFPYHLQNVPTFLFLFLFFLISLFSLPLPPKNSSCRRARVFDLVE